MPANWTSEPKRWCVRGKASDGLMVTLGRYLTEDEARADCEKIIKEGLYRDVRVDPISPRSQPTQPTSGS